MAFDRYAYVFNSPIMYIDPLGYTPVCGQKNSDPECAIIEHAKGKVSNSDLYTILQKIGFFPGIDIKNIPNPEGRTEKILTDTIRFYLALRRVVFGKEGWKFVNSSGKVADVVVASTIIQGEFGTKTGRTFDEALEALSNQYYSVGKPPGNMLCYGACTIEIQIAWLSDQEFARNEAKFFEIITNGHWADQLAYAQLATQPGGFQIGEDASLGWGDVTEEELLGYFIVDKTGSDYGGKAWFIVHAGHRKPKICAPNLKQFKQSSLL